MSEFIEVARVGELAGGSMKRVKAAGRDILLARVGDTYYAAADRCPHLGGSLCMGRLSGTVVTCPNHGARFDLADGRVLHWAGLEEAPPRNSRPFEVFQVRVEGDRILAALP